MSCTCRDMSFTFTALAKDDILFRQSCRHDIYVSSRHDISRHDIYLSSCRDISRHVATCRDVTRHILTFVVSILFRYLFFSVCSDDIVPCLDTLSSLATSWQDTHSDPRVQIPPWPILLFLVVHTHQEAFFYTCKKI